jgi:nitrous oxidase accessory protein NosD
VQKLVCLAPVALLALACGSTPARAAESLDACVGYINSLPAVISTQGTWCMAGDLATGIASGKAIEVTTNNVTIDCNHFKLGGLAAGLGTNTFGIFAAPRNNVTVRNCNVRGFLTGIALVGDGHLVENNRLDGNTGYSVYMFSDGGLVRDNLITNTGLGTAGGSPVGIYGGDGIDIIDNEIVNVTAAPGASTGADGIFISASLGALIKGNRIRDVAGDPATTGNAITVGAGSTATVSIRDNHLTLSTLRGSYAINCVNPDYAIVRDNDIQNWQLGVFNCHDGGGNVILPLP